jgi:hypothetical protein
MWSIVLCCHGLYERTKKFFHLEARYLASDPGGGRSALLKDDLLGWQVLELGLEECEFHLLSPHKSFPYFYEFRDVGVLSMNPSITA